MCVWVGVGVCRCWCVCANTFVPICVVLSASLGTFCKDIIIYNITIYISHFLRINGCVVVCPLRTQPITVGTGLQMRLVVLNI